MIIDEVSFMEEQNIMASEAEDVYEPRPRWQVWGARIALVFVIAAVALYYWTFFQF